MTEDATATAGSGPDFSEYVNQGAEAGGALGEMAGAAAGETFGEGFGMGEMAGHFVGENLGEPLGEVAGGAVGAAGYGLAELGHLAGELGDWADGHGSDDPQGGTLPPGGVPDDQTAPDGGAGQGPGDAQDEQYDAGVTDPGQ